MQKKHVNSVLSASVCLEALVKSVTVEIIAVYVTSTMLQFAHFAIMVFISMKLANNAMFKVVKIAEIQFFAMYVYRGTFWLDKLMQLTV